MVLTRLADVMFTQGCIVLIAIAIFSTILFTGMICKLWKGEPIMLFVHIFLTIITGGGWLVVLFIKHMTD